MNKLLIFFKSFRRFILDNIFILLLAGISLFICFKNYTPDTFLSGWDTLHPEFNYGEYWKRIIGGAWQEHQGLGAVNTQAHASEIPRILVLMVLDIFLDVSDIRYGYAFLMLLLGPLGVYFFVRKIFLVKLGNKASDFGAFAAGIFYLLNLGTLQHFYIPLEMFLTHYGLLGWVFLYSSMFFDKPSRKNFLLFLIFSLFIVPQAHTATLFYTYFLGLSLYFVVLSIVGISKNGSIVKKLGRTFVILFSTLLINSFWLLPNIYFVLTKSSEIGESKIHHLFSEEAFLANKHFGNMGDVAVVRGFLFDWGEHVGNLEYGQLLNEWRGNYAGSGYMLFGYIFFGCILLGVLLSMLRKELYGYGVVSLLFLSVIFLLNVNPPLGFLFTFIQNKFPIFKEAFRFPFTKFSILLIFSYAAFFGFFWGYFGHIFEKVTKSKFLHNNLYLLLTLFITSSLFFYMKPAFNGNLISPSMKVEIPNRYFKMFEYLNSQPEYGRVADFPIHSFWGWVYYGWNPLTKLGYQGAGYLWFGLEKPLIDREFDRWNLANEQVYRELSYAVYSKDVSLLEQTLEKYKIKWLLLDESIVAPGYRDSVLFIDELKELFASSSIINLDKDFGEGLLVYRCSITHTLEERNINYVNIGKHFFREPLDIFYSEFGNYIYSDKTKFPLMGIHDIDEEIVTDVITSDDNNIYINYGSILSSFGDTSTVSLADLNIRLPGRYDVVSINETFYSDKILKSLFVDTSKPFLIAGYTTPVYMQSLNLYPTLELCGTPGSNASYSIEKLSTGFSLKSQNARVCVTTPISNVLELREKSSNLLYISGTDLLNSDICIFDTETGLCENFSIGGKIFAYIDKPLTEYNLRFFSSDSLTPFGGNTVFKNIKLGWAKLEYANIFDFSNISSNKDYSSLVLPKDERYSFYINGLRNDPRLCEFGSGDLGDSVIVKNNDYIRYDSSADSLCDSFYFHNLSHDVGYIMEVKSRNIEGIPLRVCLTNETTKRCDAYFSLPKNKEMESSYYIIPPFKDGVGYSFNVSNLVFGKERSINELSYISFTPVDYDLIKSLNTGIGNLERKSNLFVYNQSYDKGWVAVCGWGFCNAEHVVVNNWANGWVFEGDMPGDIIIFFWPQLLEYLGFVLMLVPFAWLLRLRKFTSN